MEQYGMNSTGIFIIFFFNDTAPTEIYPLPLHDPLPIFAEASETLGSSLDYRRTLDRVARLLVEHLTEEVAIWVVERSEEHTSELQSRQYLVCRLLLEKKKITTSHSHLLTVLISPPLFHH